MREEYIKMRNSKTVNFQLLYTYAVDRGMTLDPQMFMNGIQFVDVNEIIENLDKEFGLTRLYDKAGNFIKVIE